MDKQTIDYYNSNAESFVGDTVGVEFEAMTRPFLKLIPESGRILDFGCGSGRDTKYFLDKGYKVSAIDGSEKLCELASEYTGITVRHMLFQELDEVEVYDGIWACSSILHLHRDELPDVMKRMYRALKPDGIIYTSFKYGTFEGTRNGRYFTDLTEGSLKELLESIPGLAVEELWITEDVRPERDDRWLNIILRKTDIEQM